jgi:Ala-tRNA(Pro) deacylase
MGVPDTVTNYLRARDISFTVVEHAATHHSAETASVAHVPRAHLAKGVVLADGERYLIAIVPANRRVDTDAVATLMQCRLGLADEDDFSMLFRDCRPGAVPPIGEAYGLVTIVDDAIANAPDIYLEAGDHEHLIHLSRGSFIALTVHAEHGRISARA